MDSIRRKLYARVDEMGIANHAIVTYQKLPFEYNCFSTGATTVHSYSSRYKNRLTLDLWLWILKFEWETKVTLEEAKENYAKENREEK